MYYLLADSKYLSTLNKYLTDLTYIVYNVSNKNEWIDTIHYYPSIKVYKLITKTIKLQYDGNRKYILLMFEKEDGLNNLIEDINKLYISVDKFIAKQSYDITTMKLNDFNEKYLKNEILNNIDLQEQWNELHLYNDYARKNYENIENWSEKIFMKDIENFFHLEGIDLPSLDVLLPSDIRLKIQ